MTPPIPHREPGQIRDLRAPEPGAAHLGIGALSLSSPFVVAPMAGMTDTAFRRLVKRHGHCGLVVTEMVSSEGLVRGIDRTIEHAEYTEEERPVAVQIFGGDPETMAEAARIVEGMGADAVDVNMGCPVPKIARHHAGCSLMRKPEHAACIVAAMTGAVKIPVTVKMRAGWNDADVNAPYLARLAEQAGASAVAVHGRTAEQAYTGRADWDLIARVAESVRIPVFGCGDLVEPRQIVEHLGRSGVAGVLVGRGILRNPWLFAQTADLLAGRPMREVAPAARGRFLLEYIDLLLAEDASGSTRRHEAEDSRSPRASLMSGVERPVRSRDRWVVNKSRALCAWYTKGFDNGSHLRVAVNHAGSVEELRSLIESFFGVQAVCA